MTWREKEVLAIFGALESHISAALVLTVDDAVLVPSLTHEQMMTGQPIRFNGGIDGTASAR
jgi:hypothetical protein